MKVTEDCLPQLAVQRMESSCFKVLGPALLVREEFSCEPMHSCPPVVSITIKYRVILSVPRGNTMMSRENMTLMML